MPVFDPAVYAALAAICTASFMEGTGVPWPGSFIVAGAAATLAKGTESVALVTGLVAVSYLCGALLQYIVGYFFGEAALAWLPAAQRSKLERMADKYGPALVFWSRPLYVGNYVSLPAGMMRMPIWRFMIYTVGGIIPWGICTALTGQLVGGQLEQYLSGMMDWILPLVLVFTVATLVCAAWKRLNRSFVWRAFSAHQSNHSGR